MRAALVVGRPIAVRTIARARRRMSPPIPDSLEGWVAILLAQEWQQRLLWCNGTNNRFFQGRLDVLSGGVSRFVGLVFANVAHLMSINIHLASVRTMCVDGTFQVLPTHPSDIAQLITIQIVINNVVRIKLFKFNFNKRIIIMNYFLGSTHYSRTIDRVNNRGLLSFVTVCP